MYFYLDDLLEVGAGGDTEGVYADPALPPAAGVEQGRLEAHLPTILQILVNRDLKGQSYHTTAPADRVADLVYLWVKIQQIRI